MPKISRNAERLNYLFRITRMIDELPLTIEEREAVPEPPPSPIRTNGLFFPRIHEDELDDGIVPDDPINSQLTANDIEDRIDMFGDMRNPMAILSISKLDEEEKKEDPPETQNQKIIREIDENKDKVEKVKKLLNSSGGRQLNIEETQRIIFLTLEGTDDKIDDIINDLRGTDDKIDDNDLGGN